MSTFILATALPTEVLTHSLYNHSFLEQEEDRGQQERMMWMTDTERLHAFSHHC